ncbi:glycoside hydrolase family 3 C-terminal domain-containing protein [Amycolatopsis sp. EV170708-02-1]|uniref:glycoside hydrolase family 3 C-terminal domain-containing protein n=1 Tax=Amycolatopsis sp. EV170708-02-1 TaxID=2919322 RepID=UPI001F0C239B|nr:glycoside hydrolase family 3 C-terminal domain-containing protein [Amycolatopsis sp. EV170708-02-1]UMP03370.1 glycoside hydrolase family 3 C-terminal domain-containing protein [Amycolatopsis sp. EV170708-02-1]
MTSQHEPTGLTLEQKASLLSGRDFWHTEAIEAAGIPSILLSDGPHGLRRQDSEADNLGVHDSVAATCFPPSVAVGNSWDTEVAARIGAAIGREARAAGVSVVLGPGVNIKRSPLCGRNFEYYSEDPLLSGVLAAAYVRAMQAEGVGASVKHFAANNQETDRMRVSVEVDERTLREIYFPAFERVVTEAHPATVMCSYNRVNGVYAAQNRRLLTGVLRDEWGFDGAVVSDWGAVNDRVAALAAGLDLEMPGTGGSGDAEIVAAVRSGELDEAVVDRSVRRVLALTGQLLPAGGDVDSDEQHRIAKEVAAGCAVLLKNDRDTLPLATRSTVAVIGGFAANPRFQGGGSSHVNPTRVDTALDAIRALGESVTYASGLADNAVEIAAEADVAVVFAGLGERDESEGFDRDTIELPAAQVGLIRAIAAVSRRTVVVLSHGGVVSLEGWHDDVDAILDGWLLGQAGGSALADLLFGITSPSGHLAESIPLRLQDNPSYLTFPGESGHVRYGEGVMVGYRYYETAEVAVRYPFGHGLSYTTFETTGLKVAATGDDSATVAVNVTNTGTRAGKHVVQVYVATDAAPVRNPARELRAFTKISLEPGETRRVELTLDRRAFAWYDIGLSRWVVSPGAYTVQIGQSAAHIVAEAPITLAGDVIVPVLSIDSAVEEWFGHPIVGPELGKLLAGQGDRAESSADWMRMVASMPMRQFTKLMAYRGVSLPTDALPRLIELSKG